MLLDGKVPFIYIINKIRKELIYIFIIGVIIAVLTREFLHLIPEIPYAIPTFLGTAISVILSFKLSQSYDRWWEARKIWGSIVNDSRNIVLQLFSFVKGDNRQLVEQLCYQQIAWCYCLEASLRNKDPMEMISDFLTVDDIRKIENHKNMPLAILNLMVSNIKSLRSKEAIQEYEHVQLNNTIVALTNWMGMAERIKTTVFPATYRLFLHLAIYMFLISLSISLRGLESYFEIPILLVIGSFFFLLEKTARHLQDPFSNKPTDTPMLTISRNIEINIRQLLGEPNVPNPIPPERFYAY